MNPVPFYIAFFLAAVGFILVINGFDKVKADMTQVEQWQVVVGMIFIGLAALFAGAELFA